jgi:hypothetical protein
MGDIKIFLDLTGNLIIKQNLVNEYDLSLGFARVCFLQPKKRLMPAN